jgi:glycosyltransferase involved in cell wall biosynthesis
VHGARSARTLLILSQVYVPDPASVGQHMADAAAEMARRGYRVVVLTANRGYDDPSVKYKRREVIDGVEVRRLPLSAFGKRSIGLRLLGSAVFMVQCVLRGIFVRNLACILVSTSPPMCSAAAMGIGLIRRAPIKYWVMDINPDQMIELGRIRERSLPARAFDWLNRRILGRARDVIALDRFMADRLSRKRDVGGKLTILPPWPPADRLAVVSHNDNPFREAHGLDGKFVLMYSGNHSLVHPVTTLLEAALRLEDDPRLVFMFIGGGLGKKDVERVIEARRPGNIVSLPYQPLSQLRYTLPAADVHLVSMGNDMVGIVHPCKVYGAMAVARPLLLLGPSPCHASELIEEYRIGWTVAHGDVDGAVATIRTILDTDPSTLAEMGARAQEAVRAGLSKPALCGRFCDALERGIPAPSPIGGPVGRVKEAS